ncbi:MAG: tRNA pseudouridine(38-40) synthase TruA [Clostridiales bacterium]|nr:tRNA pseudouridine(38-40) synthase TruA [Clostridiales bacterium]
MKRILLSIEYEGTGYSGWQRQQNGLAVQEVVERTLARVLKAPITITGASRTDAGVHALGQRAHFDTDANIPVEKWPYVLNTLLPGDIKVNHALLVDERLHARFSARQKTYEYRIFNRRQPSALRRNFSAFVPLPLEMELMRASLAPLMGRHDFSAFEAAGGTAKTKVRTLYEARLEQSGDEIILTLRGDAFLYNMVRIIAGTLIAIGQGKLAPDAFAKALASGDRLDLGITAPAQGLTLIAISYEDIP